MFEWVLMSFLCCFICARHFAIGSRIVQFEINHVNPFTLCATVEHILAGTFWAHALALLLSLFVMKLAWPLFCAGIATLTWFVRVRRAHRKFFDPISIVRNAGKVKIRHCLIASLHVIFVFYGIAIIIIKANAE